LTTGLLTAGSVLVADKSASPGGVFETRDDIEGYLFEDGPNTFQPTESTLSLVSQVGLAPDVVCTDRSLARYVYSGGDLYALPSPGGPPDLSGLVNLLSPLGMARVVVGAILPVAAPVKSDETVTDFFTRTLGSDILKLVVDPFISTVYCGDPSKMSMRSVFPAIAKAGDAGNGFGGLVKGFVASRKAAKETKATPFPESGIKVKKGSSASLKGGLKKLPEAIAGALGNKYQPSWEATKVSHSAETSLFTTEFSTPQGPKTVTSKCVVLAVPPVAAAGLVGGLSQEASEALEGIKAPAVHAVSLAYPKTAFDEEVACVEEGGGVKGFGVLVPRGEEIGTLGFQFINSMFPERAPRDESLLLAYYGGAQNPEAASLTAAEVSERVHGDALRMLLKKDAPEPRVLSVRTWPAGIPQYNVGHAAAIKASREALPPGLVLGGSMTGGVSIGDCILSARACAEEVKQVL